MTQFWQVHHPFVAESYVLLLIMVGFFARMALRLSTAIS